MKTNKNNVRKRRLKESLSDRAASVDTEHEVELARAELYKIADYAIKLHDMLKTVSEEEGIDADLQTRIAKAAEYIDEVFHTMDYDMKPDDFDISSELSLDGKAPDEEALDASALDDASLETRPSRSLESRQYNKRNIKESVSEIKEVNDYNHKLSVILEDGIKHLR